MVQPFSRWAIVTLFLVGGGILIAISLHKPVVSVVGHARSDVIHFVNTQDFHTNDVVSKTLDVGFEGNLRLSDGSVLDVKDARLFVQPAPEEVEPAATIAGFKVPAGTRATLMLDERESRLTLRFTGPALSLEILPREKSFVRLDSLECAGKACGGAILAHPLVITSASGAQVQITVDIPQRPLVITNRLEASKLAFWEPQVVGAHIEKRSGLMSGALRFLETPDQRHDLLPGEITAFKGDSMILRSATVERMGMRVQFSGQVASPIGEIADTPYYFGPTYFDDLARKPWVQAAVGASALLIGSGISLTALIVRLMHAIAAFRAWLGQVTRLYRFQTK